MGGGNEEKLVAEARASSCTRVPSAHRGSQRTAVIVRVCTCRVVYLSFHLLLPFLSILRARGTDEAHMLTACNLLRLDAVKTSVAKLSAIYAICRRYSLQFGSFYGGEGGGEREREEKKETFLFY